LLVSEDKPPPLPPRPRPRAVEPFREYDTPATGLTRPIETIADVGHELRHVRRELASLRLHTPASTPPPPMPVSVIPAPPSLRPSRAVKVAVGAWKGTQWVGVATLVITIAAQIAALFQPGLAGPLQRAAEALETLAK
jgi:hypothetical protein